MINVIASGSQGNCEIYNTRIAVDMGVPFNKIEPYIYNLQIILLTHWHKDHFNLNTIEKIVNIRPTLRIACGHHMKDLVKHINNVDIVDVGTWYDYGKFKIMPVQLYHDVPNIGYRIHVLTKDGYCYKIFRATDTAHLEGIEAKEYDMYCIEANYNEDSIKDVIKECEDNGNFCYQKGAINSHMSEQYANNYFYKYKKDGSLFYPLHKSMFK